MPPTAGLFVSTVSLAALLVGGCDTEPGVTDAGDGGDAMVDAGPGDRANPTAPALPDFGPCPEGWREISVADGAHACDPFPASGVASCRDFEAHFPGTEGCERLGTTCPADGWPTGLPADGVVYLSAGAASGDGTQASPYGTFAEALAAAAAGDVVAVAVGEYEEEVSLPAGVTLWGACTEGVVVTSSSPSGFAGVITIAGADTGIRNLTVGPSARGGVWMHGRDFSLTMSDVAIVETALVGLTLEDHSIFEGERIVVRRPQPAAAMNLGYGVNAEEGAQATINSLYVEGAVDFGVTANLADTVLTVTDLAVIDTQGLTEGQNGIGIIANAGARFVGTRVIVERATQMAAAASEVGTTMELTDAVLRDTRWGRRLDLGRGLVVQVGAAGVVRRLLVEGSNAAGVFVGGDADLTLEDTIVRETRTQLDYLGRGIAIQASRAVGRRLLVTDSIENGVAVGGAGASAELEDVTVTDIGVVPGIGIGRGISVHDGGQLTLTRAALRRVVEGGLVVQWGSDLVARDVVVDEVASREADGSAGYGVIVQRDSSLSLSNSIIRSAHQVGLIALSGVTHVDLDGVEVVDIAAPPCASAGGCVLGESGHGIGVYNEATLTATNFAVRDSALCGVHMATGGAMALSDGDISGAVIGACIQSDSQDVSGLQQGVTYQDNESNLQATMLPVPGELPSLGE